MLRTGAAPVRMTCGGPKLVKATPNKRGSLHTSFLQCIFRRPVGGHDLLNEASGANAVDAGAGINRARYSDGNFPAGEGDGHVHL